AGRRLFMLPAGGYLCSRPAVIYAPGRPLFMLPAGRYLCSRPAVIYAPGRPLFMLPAGRYLCSRPAVIYAPGRPLFMFPAGELQKRLVFMADEFDHFRAVCHDPLEHSNAERLRICFRVVDSKFDVQHSVIQTTESFG